MATTNVVDHYEVHRTLPVPPELENGTVVARGSPYGAAYVENIVPTKHILCDEGSYWVTTNPTPGTKIDYGSGGTQATFSDTVPFMLLQNVDIAGQNSRRIWFDYLKIVQIGGTAPATTTSVQFAAKIDSVLRTNTAGTLTTTTPVNTNMAISPVPASIGRLLVPAGAVATIPAASVNARLVGRSQLKGGPTLLLDEHTISSGIVDATANGGYLTTVAAYTARMPPIEIGAQQSLTFYLWLPGGATNPFSFEFECGWWER